MMHEPEKYMKTRKQNDNMQQEDKPSGNVVLIIGGLIIGGIIIAMVLKAKAKPTVPDHYLPNPSSYMVTLQERIAQLEYQLKAISTPTVLAERGGPSSEGFGFQLPGQTQSPLPLSPQNLIFNEDGSMTDADVMQGEKYKNKESWSIKRDEDGAITGIDVERNASVGNNVS